MVKVARVYHTLVGVLLLGLSWLYYQQPKLAVVDVEQLVAAQAVQVAEQQGANFTTASLQQAADSVKQLVASYAKRANLILLSKGAALVQLEDHTQPLLQLLVDQVDHKE